MLCVLKNKKRNKKWRKRKSIVIYIFLAHQYHWLSVAKDKCTSFLHRSFSICNSILPLIVFLYHIHSTKKGPYKSLHFKSLVKMHLFLWRRPGINYTFPCQCWKKVILICLLPLWNGSIQIPKWVLMRPQNDFQIFSAHFH